MTAWKSLIAFISSGVGGSGEESYVPQDVDAMNEEQRGWLIELEELRRAGKAIALRDPRPRRLITEAIIETWSERQMRRRVDQLACELAPRYSDLRRRAFELTVAIEKAGHGTARVLVFPAR